ncbi:hypothetical protein D3C73_980640 [compost metagenome]
MTGLVLQYGEVDLGQFGKAVLDVADGARGLAYGGGHAIVLRRLDEFVTGWPVDGVAFTQIGFESGVDGRQVLGEHSSSTAGICAHDQGDRHVRQFQVRVGSSDLLVIPVGDLAQEDVRVDITRQLHAFRAAWQVVSQHDLARCHWQQLSTFGHLGDVFVFHGRVTGGEIDSLVQEVLYTCPAPLGLVVHGDAFGFLAEVLEPGEVDRSREAGTGTGQAYAFRSERH